MAELKDCPESFMKCGAALVQLRHHDAKRKKLLDNAIAALKETEPDFKAAGAKGMLYGVAFDKLYDSQRAEGLVMSAHEHMAAKATEAGYKLPTDEELVKYGVPLNWR